MFNNIAPTLPNLQSYLDSHDIEHFTAKEITWLNRLSKNIIPHHTIWGNIIPTLKLADAIRKEWDGPVRVFSGFRTIAYNAAVGGAKNSQHLHFRAMDISPADGRVDEFGDVVKSVVKRWRAEGNQVGMGEYDSFIHIDVGFKTRSWRG
jgi:uncharacterized protein YcbK (DUF882 family)